MEAQEFLNRVMSRLPTAPPAAFQFSHWQHAGRPTEEGFGLMPIPGLNPEKLIQAVMSVDRYTGNIDHVAACRSIPDPRFTPPQSVRFYQKVDVPMLASIQHELVLTRMPAQKGYEIAAWYHLGPETDRLNPKDGARSEYSLGAWIAAPGVLGYALASCPRREDVGFLKWKALTAGADVAASKVLTANLEGMARWAARI